MRKALPFAPAGLVAAAWVLWAHFEGAYFPRTWYPSALAALAVLATVWLAGGRVLPPQRSVRLALALLAAFVAWTYLSVAWSESPGDGLPAANELLLVLLVTWMLALLPWTPTSAAIFMGAWALGITAVCAISLLGAQGGHVPDYFVKDRYSDPTGYSNATAALAALAFWPAVMLAYRRTTPLPLRPVFLASAVLLMLFSLLPQSRGSMIGMALTLPLFVLLAPERLRLIPVGLVIAVAIALTVGPIYRVNDVSVAVIYEYKHLAVGPVLDHAISGIWIAVLLSAVAGLVLALLDRVVKPSPSLVRGSRRAVAVVLIAAAVIGLGAAVVNAGTIRDGASNRWDTFKSNENTVPKPGARLTAVGSDQRYDYWRVALNAFRAHPVAGIGAGAYERYYTRYRIGEKPSRYTHNFWLRVLAEGGIVMMLLLLAYLAVVFVPPLLSFRRAPPAAAAVSAAALAASFGLFAHSTFDWLEEFPALISPAFALPVVALVAASPWSPAPPGGRAPRIVTAACAAAFVAAAAFALVPGWLSTRYEDRATRTWTAAPAAAFSDLDRAADLAPLSPRPLLRAGTLALDLRRYNAARALFARSIEREDNWYARFELALIASMRGKQREAEREIRIARTLNGEDRFVSDAVHRIGKGERLHPEELNNGIRRLNKARFTAPRI